MERKLEKYNLSYSKYSNWPSCDSTVWMFRYWGENYNRLLAIKVLTHLKHSHHYNIYLTRHTGTLRMCSTTARVSAVRIIFAVLLLYRDHRDHETLVANI
jgi:hypothetical protein